MINIQLFEAKFEILSEILKISPKKPDYKIITMVGEQLRAGKIIVFPTDTVYGLGCDPFNINSIQKIYSIKKRQLNMGLPVLINSIESIKHFAVINPISEKIIDKFWPGQLTIILEKHDKVPKLLTGDKDTIAIRYPDNSITISLIKELKVGGIVGTSANISGEKSPTNVKQAISQLGNRVDYYIDGGESEKKVPSTIIDLTNNKLKLIRKGPIPFNLIKSVL